MPELRVATYNVHGCVGADGRFDPPRVGRVLAELDADVIVLQEVRELAASLLAGACGMTHAHGATRSRFGNAILVRGSIELVHRWDLSIGRREPRGCLRAEITVRGAPLSAVAVHLGLGRGERGAQIARLLSDAGPLAGDAPLVLAGDFNDWLFGPTRRLTRIFSRGAYAPSFPARLPLLALDRIYARGLSPLARQVHRSPLARIASDHLPVVADYLLSTADEDAAGASEGVGRRSTYTTA